MRQMDIDEYIKKKKKDLNKSSENIKNSNVFQFNYNAAVWSGNKPPIYLRQLPAV